MMTYEYTLYQSHRNRKIDEMLRECCFVWNHALALQKRYYRLFKGFISLNTMQKHFAKRISRKLLHSQTVQEVLQTEVDAHRCTIMCLSVGFRRSIRHQIEAVLS